MYSSKNLFRKLNQFGLFVLVIVSILAVKMAIQRKKPRECLYDCFNTFRLSSRSLDYPVKKISFIENVSHITIGNIILEKSDCMYQYLKTFPEYIEQYVNSSDDYSNYTCLDVFTKSKTLPLQKFKLEGNVSEDLFIKDEEYEYLTNSCVNFKTNRGYIMLPLNDESKHFPIAFNIIIHKSVHQFELLLRAIYRPQNFYCIHVDTKSSNSFRKGIESIASCFDNVFLSSKSESIIWAGFSRLQADITCMKDQLQRSNNWKYLINTAGQAFPLRTIEEMVQILKIYNGSNDIEGLYGKRLLKFRYEQEWVEDHYLLRMRNTYKSYVQPPHNLDIVRGSVYGIFSRKFVEYVVHDPIAIDFLEWSKKTWSPDELFWATLHHTYSNPHLKTPGGFSDHPMKKEWMAVHANWGEYPCHGKLVRTVCINGVGDLPRLINRKEFFINKFYLDYQPLALGCMTSWIRFKEMCHVPFDPTFYRGLKFIGKL